MSGGFITFTKKFVKRTCRKVSFFFFLVNTKKLVNMVFNIKTLSVKIKALKIVDRDKI